MRKIVDSYTTRHGELKAIYSVATSSIKHRDIEIGALYELEYRLGNQVMFLKGELDQATEGNRTLFFKHPDPDRKLIGIPVMSIIRYVKK
jgi:hypothetical protein